MARHPKYASYDPRVKALISRSGRPDLFPHLKIPRTTALYWISQEYYVEDPILDSMAQTIAEMSDKIADTEKLFRWFRDAEAECKASIAAGVPLAAYDQAIEASHVFNLLQARGVISVQERASYIGRVRDLAKGSCQAWIEKNEARWAEQFPGWTV